MNQKKKTNFSTNNLKEAAESYGITEKEAAERSYKTIKGYPSRLPVHIWQRMTGAPYPYSMHAGVYKDMQKRQAARWISHSTYLSTRPESTHLSVTSFTGMKKNYSEYNNSSLLFTEGCFALLC